MINVDEFSDASLTKGVKKPKDIRGLTMTFCFGRFGGFYATASTATVRVCLGWFAITMYFLDFEAFVQLLRYRLSKAIKIMEDKLERD